MSKVLVLYYSTYGHIETMAEAEGRSISNYINFALRQYVEMKRGKVAGKSPGK